MLFVETILSAYTLARAHANTQALAHTNILTMHRRGATKQSHWCFIIRRYWWDGQRIEPTGVSL